MKIETVDRQLALATGTLRLTANDDAAIDRLCAIAARANPKRGFLIVSRVLGRHLPARPQVMRAAMADLAGLLPSDLPGPVVLLGMAETATALAQGTFAAFQARHPQQEIVYLQTSRQQVAGARVIARFEEQHSHATSHIVQLVDQGLAQTIALARTLVIVDDECSTGGTFGAAAKGMAPGMPALEQIHCCCLTDWSDDRFLADMPHKAFRHALLNGKLEWQPSPGQAGAKLETQANGHGYAPRHGMRSRTGLVCPEAAQRREVTAGPQERVLVLGDGEHAYEALLIAEEVELQGGIAAIQSITRTPAMLGHAMLTVTRLADAYGSGATCYLYNIGAHRPDRIVLAAEIEAGQQSDLATSLTELGLDVPVELALCHYGEGLDG